MSATLPSNPRICEDKGEKGVLTKLMVSRSDNSYVMLGWKRSIHNQVQSLELSNRALSPSEKSKRSKGTSKLYRKVEKRREKKHSVYKPKVKVYWFKKCRKHK